MMRPGTMLAAMLVMLTAGATARAKMEMRTFPVLTGAGAHDVYPAPDGAVWFTAQSAGKLGRLDPRTGKSDLIALGPGAAPHGVIVGPDGAAWVTDGGLNAIVRVDAATKAVKVFALPKGTPYTNLNTAAFDRNGILWYTGQSGYYGRVDPKSGEVKEWQSPSGPKSAPYGISAIKDVLWYSESEASPNTIVRFDPKSEKFQSWTIPGGGNIVRNVDVTRDGNWVLANSLVNEVTLVRIEK